MAFYVEENCTFVIIFEKKAMVLLWRIRMFQFQNLSAHYSHLLRFDFNLG